MIRSLASLAMLAALLISTAAPTPSAAIVTANMDSRSPATDPHLVDGPVDVSELVFEFTGRPAIDPAGIVEIQIQFNSGSVGTCSAALIDTSEGVAVLTAAHCVGLGSAAKVWIDLLINKSTQRFETCHDADDDCDIYDFVLIHPDFRVGNNVLDGYDLALIFFEQAIPAGNLTKRYEIAPANLELDAWNSFVKFGFGCSGYGGDGVDQNDPANFDHQLRFAVNTWDSNSLGAYGVPACDRDFDNFETQLVYDFDNYGDYANNLYNFYMQTFDPATGWIETYPTCFGPCGIFNAEGWSCPGDSGGPNFTYDSASGKWYLRAVSSYVLRMNDDFNGFSGNSDFDEFFEGGECAGRNFTFGEYGGDALVTPEMIDEILAGPKSRPKGSSASYGLGHGLTQGGLSQTWP